MANNPYVNKVVYDGTTLIDITDSTATAPNVASGYYFYLATGEKKQGTASLATATVSGTVLYLTDGFPVSV